MISGTYEGQPTPTICDYLGREEFTKHYAGKAKFHVGKIEMVSNLAPTSIPRSTAIANGKDLSELPLASLANLETVAVRHNTREEGQAVGRDLFEGWAIRPVKRSW